MTISPVAVSAAFVFGLAVGSFLNVCIWRLPAGEQIVSGRSHCQSCGKTIGWYDNIPLVSFALLRGRCRHCGAGISWSYPFVELATGILLAGVVWRFGLTSLALVYAFLGAVLIVLAMVDLREMILPDEITLPGISIGVILSFYVPELHGTEGRWHGLASSVLGALAGAGTLWAIGVVGKRIFRKDAMGFGDVKLMGMVGSLVGTGKVLLVNFILAPMVGAVVGVILKLRYRKDLIPYGPFLAMGTLAAIFWGNEVIGWYLGLLGFGVR